MSAVITPPPGLPAPPPYPVCQLTVDGYHQMIETGLIGEDARVELLEGWIVPQMPHNPRHDGTVQRANRAVSRRLPAGWEVRVQSAVTTDDSEPEPDLAVVREDPTGYLHRHPGPADIAALMEVSESSLTRDREDKGRLYARANVPCYWILNLADGRVEVYTDPTGPGPDPRYRRREDFDLQAAVPLVVNGQECGPVPVGELLP